MNPPPIISASVNPTPPLDYAPTIQSIVDAIRRKAAPPQNTRLGGQIYIHGNGSQTDWTWGCVALDDKDIRELFDAVPVKTPVVIEH